MPEDPHRRRPPQTIEDASRALDDLLSQLCELASLAEILDTAARESGLSNPIASRLLDALRAGLSFAQSFRETIEATRVSDAAKAGKSPGKAGTST